MMTRASLRPNMYGYSGSLLHRSLANAEEEIKRAFKIRDAHFHDHVYMVLDELTHNAAQHSPHGHKEARVTVDQDDVGAFVEVVSISSRDKAEFVKDFVLNHRFLSDQELQEAEIDTFKRNMGTGRGGVGLYQVLRSSMLSERGRLVYVGIEECDDAMLVELSVRAYVSIEAGGKSRATRRN